jgi:hypothetical protein
MTYLNFIIIVVALNHRSKLHSMVVDTPLARQSMVIGMLIDNLTDIHLIR